MAQSLTPSGSLPDMPGDSLAPVRDRMTTTLFVAALFHGIVILGITFGMPDAPRGGLPAMEVMLLTEPGVNDEINPEAEYLAQRNQRGSGTTQAHVKPGSPPSSLLPANLLGVPDGTGVEWREALTGQPSVDLVSSFNQQNQPTVRSGANSPAQMAETPLALLYTPPSPIVATSLDATLTLRGDIIHEIEVAPNTRESRVAPYLDSWKRKVERLGTVKFPMAARERAMHGNPVLEVVIRSDGTIRQIVVRKSSGHKELDQAAIGILRLASPFDPFPAALKEEFDQLRFAYEWQFVGDKLKGSVTMQP